MKGRTLSLVSVILLGTVASPGLNWDPDVYDFGAIAESDGVREGEFRFINTETSPLTILKVRTSCGCTVATFDEEEILPGDTAVIHFYYDPTRRPGRFDKTMKVRYTLGSGDPQTDTLQIRGMVIASEETLSADYPFAAGPLRLSTKTADLGHLKEGVSRHGFIQLFNTSADTVSAVLKTDSEALEARQIPDRLAPGEGGIFSFRLDSDMEQRSGELIYRIEAVVNGNSYSIPVRAEVEGSRKKIFSKTYIEKNKKSDKVDKGKKKTLFSKTYTEVKKKQKKKMKIKQKPFSKTYVEIK